MRPSLPPFAALLAIAAMAILAAPAAAATTIGSNLNAVANGGPCGYGTFDVVELHCGGAQETLDPGHASAAGLVAPLDGIVVRWRVKSAAAGADVAAIGLRLQLLAGNRGGLFSDRVELPLDQPGVHEFPTRMPILAGERLAVDTILTNRNKGGISAPIVHYEPGVGAYNPWFGQIAFGEAKMLEPTPDNEVLVNADIEADADRDGFGDESQDLCPKDPATHAIACAGSPVNPVNPPSGSADTTPPRTQLTFAPLQRFLASKHVKVKLHSNEAGTAIASGQLEIPSKHEIWGIGGAQQPVGASQKATLRLQLPGKARQAAQAAANAGRKVVVKVTVLAQDAAGNNSGQTVAVIRPRLPRHR